MTSSSGPAASPAIVVPGFERRMRGMQDRATPIRGAAAVLVALIIVATVPSVAVSAKETKASRIAECRRADQPPRFRRQLIDAIRISRDLPIAWADSPNLKRIVCWQGTSFDPGFRAAGDRYHAFRGIFAMTVREMKTIQGTWMTARRDAYELSPRCFVHGWDACANTRANRAEIQQIIAGLRWIWLQYGNPRTAWRFIRLTGRFTSYPRPGTTDGATTTPFRRCPVDRPVYYRDDFGERRTVGGYHPHWGNDVIAPAGRRIRAPFDGIAVAHRDSWFAGIWVTVVGRHGYVRNVHLRKDVRTGRVETGDVIGIVGSTGDARGPHDHFEWHPWVAPYPLHRAPSGFRIVMDAIDPYPFLNRVCRSTSSRRAAELLPRGYPERPIGE